MDVFYSVKQLAHELNILEAQIAEKKAALRKLWPSLSHQEQTLLDSPHAPTDGPDPLKTPAIKPAPKAAGAGASKK